MADTKREKIPKLNNTNYESWSYRMEVHLKNKKVWNTIINDEPVQEADQDNEAFETIQEEWNEKSANAVDIIVQGCEDNQLVYIRRADDTARGVWEALRNQHRVNTASNQVRLTTKLSTTSNKNKPDLRELLSKNNGNKETDVVSARVARFNKWYTKSLITSNEQKRSQWCVDSGATFHACGDKESFSVINEISNGRKITTADGNIMVVKGVGEVELVVSYHNTEMTVTLSGVLWLPGLDCSLISVHKLTEKGFKVEFDRNCCYIQIDNERRNIARFDGSIYALNVPTCCMIAKDASVCVHQWHRRLAHRNLDAIKAMKKEGLKISECNCSDVCEACMMGKMSRLPFPRESRRTKNVLDVIVSDVCGPIQESSLGGNRYLITFTDVHSGHVTTKFLASKGGATRAAIEHCEWIKTQLGREPKVFRTDRGKEYLNNELQSYLRSKGIRAEYTVGYAPEQNGVAERMNRTLIEAARTMMKAANLPFSLWAEAVHTAAFVFNRTTSGKTGKTPHEVFFNEKARNEEFHEFGCEAYVMIPYEKRRKLDDKAEKMIFVGYDDNAKGYRFIHPMTNQDERIKVTVHREAHFLENESPKEAIEDANIDNESELVFDEDEVSDETIMNNQQPDGDDDNDVFEDAEDNEEVQVEVAEPVAQPGVQDNPPPARHSDRANFGRRPERYNDFVMYKTADDVHDYEPKTFDQAVSCDDSESWKKAMMEELESINNNDTWSLQNLPEGRKAVGSKWVFKIKPEGSDGEKRFKARLVAQGFSQKFGVDYDEVFAPVAKSATFRLLLSVAGTRNLKVKHYDIKTAFLNGKLEEEIYLKQPPGFTTGNKVYRLKKSLYGLKQAARVWNEVLKRSLLKNNCEQSQEDQCLYIRKSVNGTCYILVHVDDILVAGENEFEMEELMKSVGRDFELKDLGDVQQYLGIEVERTVYGDYAISQTKYIDKIIQTAGLQDAKASKFPMDTGYYKLEGDELNSNEKYRQLIGSLLYLSTNTRPDISAAVSILSQRVINPRTTDMNEVKRLIRYLKGTRNMKLHLSSKNTDESLVAYSDSDWAEDRVDRKSNSGFICYVLGGAVSWTCKKQDIVALSSTEAEYVALTETCKEVLWLKRLTNDFNILVPETTLIKTDSQSCVAMIYNQKSSGRTKHIDARYHFIRNQVEEKRVCLKYHPTETNVADLLTKPLGGTKIAALRRLAGLEMVEQQGTKEEDKTI